MHVSAVVTLYVCHMRRRTHARTCCGNADYMYAKQKCQKRPINRPIKEQKRPIISYSRT